jgi:hypothetical protein
MERLIDKIFIKLNNNNVDRVDGVINKIENIKKIKNVEISDENDKKIFIYKNYGIQIKNGIKFKIIFFKIIDDTSLEKLFELENVKIKLSHSLFVMYKCNEFWKHYLYDNNYLNLLLYFCKKFNIKTISLGDYPLTDQEINQKINES